MLSIRKGEENLCSLRDLNSWPMLGPHPLDQWLIKTSPVMLAHPGLDLVKYFQLQFTLCWNLSILIGSISQYCP